MVKLLSISCCWVKRLLSGGVRSRSCPSGNVWSRGCLIESVGSRRVCLMVLGQEVVCLVMPIWWCLVVFLVVFHHFVIFGLEVVCWVVLDNLVSVWWCSVKKMSGFFGKVFVYLVVLSQEVVCLVVFGQELICLV